MTSTTVYHVDDSTVVQHVDGEYTVVQTGVPLTVTTGGGSGAPTSAQYVVLSADGTLTDERVLTAGTGITITDAGAGSTVTVGVTANTYQPLDSDLTAIAALSTTSFGRALLELADAAAGRTALGLGSLATASTITTSEITDGTIVNADISASAAIAASKISGLGTVSTLASDTDGTLAADSDSNVATQKATKTYADTKVPKSTVTAKGDVIAATASATVTNVAVGANGKALKADSTASAGVAWDYAVPPTGDPKTGSTTYYVQPGFVPTTVTTHALAANVRYFYQFWLPTAATCDQIAIEQTAAAAAGKLFRIGLIAADKWWQPTGSVLIESGTFAADGANGVKTYTPGSPVLLPPGNYLGVVHSDGAPAIRVSAGGIGSGATGYLTTLGGATLGWMGKSMALAAIDNTAWDTISGAIAAMRNGVWLRLSDPTS